MKKKMNPVGIIDNGLNKVLSFIQVITIIASGVLVTLDVFMRAAFAKPISGTAEYVGYIMILASFFGLGMGTMDRAHLKVDLIVQTFPEKQKVINDLCNSIIVGVVAFVMLYASINQGMITYGLQTKGTFSRVLNWPFYMLMGLGYLAVVLGAISNFIEDIGTLKELKAHNNQKGEAGA